MPWTEMNQNHNCTVLTQQVGTGRSLGIRRQPFRASVPPVVLSCTVCPLVGHEVVEQGERSFVVPHDVFFAAEPLGTDPNTGATRRIDQRDRLQWAEGGNVILRIVAPPIPLGGIIREWKMSAEFRTEDQVGVAAE